MKTILYLLFAGISLFARLVTAQNKLDIVTSEPIKLFHGARSVIEFDGKERTKNFEVLSAEGATVTVIITNPNYLLYQYSSVVKEVQLADDMPDVLELVGALNRLTIPGMPENLRAGVPCVGMCKYASVVNTLLNDLDSARSMIVASDDETQPLSIYLAMIGRLPHAKYRFNDPSLEANLLELVEISITGTSSEEKLVSEALQAQVKELAKKVNDLKATLTTKQSFIYQFNTGKKPYTICIIAQAKKGVTPRRAVDTLAQVTVYPYITSSWELVPTLNFVYATGGKDFGVKNGLITERDMDVVTPRYGVFLVRNIWNWGKYNEVHCGMGVGFAMRTQQDQQILNNLQAGFFTNIKDFLKLGVGVGIAQVPTGLSESAVGEALPASVSSIDDIVTYSNRPAAFLSITIFGFKFPKK